MTFVYGGTTVTIADGIILPANDLPKMVHWQSKNMAADGTVYVFNHDVTEWFILCSMRVDNTNRAALRSFLQTTVEFAERAFVFTPDTGVDAGAGASAAIAVRYWDESWSERTITSGVYEVSLILHATSTGTANPASS